MTLRLRLAPLLLVVGLLNPYVLRLSPLLRSCGFGVQGVASGKRARSLPGSLIRGTVFSAVPYYLWLPRCPLADQGPESASTGHASRVLRWTPFPGGHHMMLLATSEGAHGCWLELLIPSYRHPCYCSWASKARTTRRRRIPHSAQPSTWTAGSQ